MKHFTFILSLYMLLLALMPCSDKSDCSDEKVPTTTVAADNPGDHADHSEYCSPFCFCACCGQFLNVAKDYAFVIKSGSSFFKNINTYQEPYFDLIPRTIWQPPQRI